MEDLTEEELQSFYADICSVVDEHGDNIDQKEALIDGLEEFRDSWLDTLAVTGSLWLQAPDEQEIIRVDSAIPAETVLKTILDQGELSYSFITDGGNGDQVDVGLTVTGTTGGQLRELFLSDEIELRMNHHGLSVKDRRPNRDRYLDDMQE